MFSFVKSSRQNRFTVSIMVLFSLLLPLLAFSGAAAAPGDIRTVAGGGVGDGGPATSAVVSSYGLYVTGDGEVLIGDLVQARIRKVDVTGVISTIAGNGSSSFSGDGGQATAAGINGPIGFVKDSAGNLYFSDTYNHRVRKISQSGTVSTIAGTGMAGYNGDGINALSATLYYPSGMTIDGSGNIYVADQYNNRIRKITPGGIISTVAGNGAMGFSGDGGTATYAALNSPSDVLMDPAGNLSIADTGNNRIRKVTSAGVISTIAGNGTASYGGDGGLATAAYLNAPSSLARDSSGNLHFADRYNCRIRYVNTSGRIYTKAGNGACDSSGDGSYAGSAGLNDPAAVAISAAGELYIGEATGNRVRKVASNGIITTFAGNGEAGYYGDGGPALDAAIASPAGIAAKTDGTLFLSHSNRIRKVDPAGIISRTAGFRTAIGLGDDGPAMNAYLFDPRGLFIDIAGNVFIADRLHHRIRKIDPSGVITTVAGNGTSGYSGDNGAATAAKLSSPSGVFVDRDGNLFIADTLNQRIRKVNASGVISTVAGNGTQGRGSDGILAIYTNLSNPENVLVDDQGNIIIVDTNNDRIRKVNSSGIITTIAGSATRGYGGDGGPATSAQLNGPTGAAIDAEGNLLIADTENSRIRKVDGAGIITTIAGTAARGFSGDGGPALAANLNKPSAIVLDPGGNLYIADAYSARIRMVEGNDSVPDPFAFTGQANADLNVVVESNPVSVTGINIPSPISVQNGEYQVNNGSWTTAQGAVNNGDTVRVRLVTSSNYFTPVTADLNIGGVTGSFIVTTLPTHLLQVSKLGTGNGTVTSTPSGILCGDTCLGQFPQGTSVTMSAMPDDYSTFTGWSGACGGTGTCTVTMSDVQFVNAEFTAIPCGQPLAPAFTFDRSSSINDLGEVVSSLPDYNTGQMQVYSTTRGLLTQDPNDHRYPAVNNQGDVVWEQPDPAGGSRIYGLIAGQLKTFSSLDSSRPSINGGGEVVWSQYDPDTRQKQIFSSLRGRVTADLTDHWDPSINDRGDIVWLQYVGNYPQVVGLLSGVRTEITTDYIVRDEPAIGNSGEVVWVQADSSGTNRIFSNRRGQLTFACPAGTGNRRPSINACGDVTFANGENGQEVPYRLGSNSPCVTDAEPNDIMSQANLISGNTTTMGLLDAEQDGEDWYRFTANSGDQITVSVNWNSQAPATLIAEVTNAAGVLAVASEPGTPKTITIAAPETGTFYVHLMALSGSRIGYALSVTVRDITPPTVTIDPVTALTNLDFQPLSGTRETDAVVTVTANTGAFFGEVMYPTATTWSTWVYLPAPGENIITVTAADAAANSATATATITLDIVPPAVTIASPASGLTNVTSPLLAFSVSDGTVVVKVDGVTVSKASGSTLDPLADGPHTIQVEATDGAGNVGFAEVSLTVDTAAPSINLISPGAGLTGKSRPQLQYTVSDGAVVVKVDGSVVNKVSGDTLDLLSEGPHTFRLEATDAAGNTAFAEVSFTVDTIAPTVTIGSPAAGIFGNSAPILTYAASDGAIVVKVDGAVVDKASGSTLDPLADGPHTVRVEAADAANNTGFAEVSFTVDTTAPTVTIASPSAGPTKFTTPALTYVVSDGVVVVKVDGVVVDKVSGNTLDLLADGPHTVRVEATDAANNTGFAEVSFTVDTVAPRVAISTPVAGSTKNNAPVLTYSASDGTVVVKVDGVVVSKVSGNTLDPLADGPHTVRVEATDAAANTGFAEVSFTVDTAAPTIVITSPAAGLTNNSMPVLTFTASDGVIVVKVDGVAVSKISGNTLDLLANGTHTVRVEATDEANNLGFAEVTFTVDTMAPVVAIISPVPGTTINNRQVLTYTVSDGTVTVKVDGVVVNKVSGNTLDTLANGLHTVRVESRDAAGNDGAAEVSFTVNYTTLTVSTTSLAWGVTGAAYAQNSSANGGVPPYAWSIQQGTLPEGLSLDPCYRRHLGRSGRRRLEHLHARGSGQQPDNGNKAVDNICLCSPRRDHVISSKRLCRRSL